MDERIVREVVEEQGYAYAPHASIYATIKPSVGAYKAGLGAVMNTMKDHVLHFGPKGIVVIPTDDRNGILRDREVVFIPNATIEGLDMSMKRFHLELVIATPDGEIVYKIRRNVVNNPWHKENLAHLLLSADVKDE